MTMEDEFENEKHFYVDIPQLDSFGIPSEEWRNVETFSTKEDAIQFAQIHLGADENGMICVVSG